MLFAEVARLARGQHGIVTRRQLRALGMDEGRIQRELEAGRLEIVHAGVYRVAGAPRTWHSAVAAAVLAAGAGAAASHRSAAALWRLTEDPTDVVEVSVPVGRYARLDGVAVHRIGDLCPDVVARRDGIAVTNPLHTLVHLGAVVPRWQVEDALERGLVRRLYSVAAVEAARAAVARPGRNGGGVLRGILDDRALGQDRPDSLLEVRMASLLRAAGLPAFEFQHRICDGAGRLVAVVDFARPAERLALEVDGLSAHGSAKALQSDLDRQNAVLGLGWDLRRFTWHDVVRRPAKVAASVRLALRAPVTGIRW